MSVIFGIKEENQIIIAGDKRETNKYNGQYSDDSDKVIIINEHLAFASAGNTAMLTAIKMEIDKIRDKEKMFTDDLLEIIKEFYKGLTEKKLTLLLSYPYCFVIGGKNRKNSTSLFVGLNTKGGLSTQEAQAYELALLPPDGLDRTVCNDIFLKKYNSGQTDFVEKTIYEISEININVSPTGDKWIYNIKQEKGVLHTF